MNKQTKNVITLEYITEELRFYNNANIKAALLCGGVIALLFIPLTFLIVNEVYSNIDGAVLQNVLGIGLGIAVSSPVWGTLWAICQYLAEGAKIRNGDFDITLCTLQYKGERSVQRHIEEYFSFGGFKDVSVSSTAYSLAIPGDEYYIVHYKNSTRIKLLYSTKTHELKTEENGYGKG